MLKIIYLIIIILIPCHIFGQPKTDTPTFSAHQFLQMQTEEVFPIIERMSRNEAAILVTQIRAEVKKEYPQIDKFYLLISHLESIRAIKEEQKRLKSLHYVYGLALFLFTSVLGYVIFSQRKIIFEMKNLSQPYHD